MADFIEDKELEKFCVEIMKEEYKNSPCAEYFDRIKFLYQSDMRPTTWAKIFPVRGPLSIYVPISYIVCFNFDIWNEVLRDSDETRRVLVIHQLCHIPFNSPDKFIESKLLPFDRQGFRKIFGRRAPHPRPVLMSSGDIGGVEMTNSLDQFRDDPMVHEQYFLLEQLAHKNPDRFYRLAITKYRYQTRPGRSNRIQDVLDYFYLSEKCLSRAEAVEFINDMSEE